MGIAGTAGSHLNGLTAVDASFLTNETSSSHMHIGGILIFEGPPPPYVDLVEHVRGGPDQAPRFRQRLGRPPPGGAEYAGPASPARAASARRGRPAVRLGPTTSTSPPAPASATPRCPTRVA